MEEFDKQVSLVAENPELYGLFLTGTHTDIKTPFIAWPNCTTSTKGFMAAVILYGLSRVPELAELGYRCAPVKNYLVLYKVADGIFFPHRSSKVIVVVISPRRQLALGPHDMRQ